MGWCITALLLKMQPSMQPSNHAVYRFMDCTLQVVVICDCTVISHQALSQWSTCLYWLEWNLFGQALSAFIGRGFLKNYKMSGMDSPSTPSWLEGRRFLAQVEGRCRSRAAMSGWRAASSLHAPVPSSSSNGKPRWGQNKTLVTLTDTTVGTVSYMDMHAVCP